MPPIFATIICLVFILYLFLNDSKRHERHSRALWIPWLWMFLAGSRYIASWIDLGPPIRYAESYNEGSPLNAVSFFLLISAGAFVLLKRKVDWGRLLIRNKWVLLYFLYCGSSIIWSDYPFISLKRYVKELGNVIMVLVILTEERPYEALGVILKRLAFAWLPLSVLFIKYYPDLGRAYHPDGTPMYTGVGQQKNDLGLICLMAGIYYSWNFFLNRKKDDKLKIRNNISDFILIGTMSWLLYKADSATSLACLVAAVTLFFMSRMKFISRKPDRIVVLLVVVVSLYSVLDTTLDLKNLVIGTLGRDPTLTTRVPIWNTLNEMVVNPIVGAGYQSFWAGDRLELIWERIEVHITQAHNGFLEQYLNLGYIGVAFIGIIILSGLLKVKRQLKFDYPSAMLKLCFILIAVLYNYTEASFYGINNMWLLTLFGIIDYSAPQGPKSDNGRNPSEPRK